MKNLKLYSDFIDYYDHYFDISGERFNRFSTGGMNRIEMFDFLKKHGYEVPKHGTVKEISTWYPDRWGNYIDNSQAPDDNWKYIELVVYTDIKSHHGEGKVKMYLNEAIEKYPDNFASFYLFNWSTSYRYLQIGEKVFWLRYMSLNDWRSNCGNVKILIENQKTGYHKSIKYPLFAIDFISIISIDNDKRDRRIYKAIDFNISPQIKGTGIEEILEPREVVELIKNFIKCTNT